MKRLKKVTICLMMSLVVLVASFAVTSVRVKAAEPYWGAAYLEAGANEVTIYINGVKGPVTQATVKSWDFSSSSYGTMTAQILDPSNNSHGLPGWLGFNDTQVVKMEGASYGSGTYKIVINVWDGNHSGGWIGAWLY